MCKGVKLKMWKFKNQLMSDEIILWGSVVFVAILLSNPKVCNIIVLFIVLCFCIGKI